MIKIPATVRKYSGIVSEKIRNSYNSGVRYKKNLTFDVFEKITTKGLSKMEDIHAGEHGTTCKGAIPLEDFFSKFDSQKKELLLRGYSTNDRGYAYTFLKSKSDCPLSTSYVCDCSVLYLYNQNKDTHMLYHLYSAATPTETTTMIQKLMPEGYTHVGIVPGTKEYVHKHRQYLPEIFSAIKKDNKNAVIKVYSESSKFPEIVGYKGELYEIPNKKIINNIVPESNDIGQASFTINDTSFRDVINTINSCNDITSLKKLKRYLRSENYSKECLHTFDLLIFDRAKNIRNIEGCRSMGELFEFLKDKTHNYFFGDVNIGDRGYYDVISDKKLRLSGEKC